MALTLPETRRGGALSPVARTRPLLRSFTTDGVAGLAEERGVPRGTMASLGLPAILQRRSQRDVGDRSPRWTCSEELETWTALESERRLKVVESPAQRHNGVLDFEHLFSQFFVQVRASRMASFWHEAELAKPEEVAAAWAEDAAAYILRHREVCYSYWPHVQLEYSSVHQRVLQEMEWTVEWSGRRYCVVVSLLPERVCHRLLWAIGDALLPDLFLRHTQQSLQRRFRGQRFRCCDTVLRPWGTFQTLLVLCSGILLLCFRSALYYRELLQVEKPLREEALDHLASRLLLLGGFGHLWVFYLIAAFFPLRTLHSPLNRDLGSMAAYSNCSLQAVRLLLPLVSSAKLLALLVRFRRLGIAPWPIRSHLILLPAALLPLVAIAVCLAMRSSFYSYYHASCILLAALNGLVTIGFTAYLEVGWAVLLVAAVLLAWLLLFTQYTAEFTKANLMKAAQIQWACVHCLVVLVLVLAMALEVEAGFARRFVKLFCETQTLVPMKVCQRLLSGRS